MLENNLTLLCKKKSKKIKSLQSNVKGQQAEKK